MRGRPTKGTDVTDRPAAQGRATGRGWPQIHIRGPFEDRRTSPCVRRFRCSGDAGGRSGGLDAEPLVFASGSLITSAPEAALLAVRAELASAPVSFRRS